MLSVTFVNTQELRFTSPRFAELGTTWLVPTGEGTFFDPRYYTQVRAVLAPDGSLVALEWAIEGHKGRWERVKGQRKGG